MHWEATWTIRRCRQRKKPTFLSTARSSNHRILAPHNPSRISELVLGNFRKPSGVERTTPVVRVTATDSYRHYPISLALPMLFATPRQSNQIWLSSICRCSELVGREMARSQTQTERVEASPSLPHPPLPPLSRHLVQASTQPWTTQKLTTGPNSPTTTTRRRTTPRRDPAQRSHLRHSPWVRSSPSLRPRLPTLRSQQFPQQHLDDALPGPCDSSTVFSGERTGLHSTFQPFLLLLEPLLFHTRPSIVVGWP